MTTFADKAQPGYARFDGTETPEEIETMVKTAFAPVRSLLDGLRRAERRARIELYREHPPRDARGRFARWPR